MAEIHDTTMTPGKLELLAAWLPRQPWYVEHDGAPALARVAGFRLDDPAGEVGIECYLVSDQAAPMPVVYAVPMTYRGEPLASAAQALIGTGEHGVLGPRWIYDATRDPVFVAQTVALLRGEVEPQHQSRSDTVDTTVTVDGTNGSVHAPPTTTSFEVREVAGATLVQVGALTLRVVRVPEPVATSAAQVGAGSRDVVSAVVSLPWQRSDGSMGRGPVIVAESTRAGHAADVSALIAAMTLEEKCRLLGGASSWRTNPVERLGIPAIKMSDGPNGVRGEHAAGDRTPSVVIPVGIAQGATWDPRLVEQLGGLLGREARRKSAHVVLAPAVNLHRTPIGGRTFEYFSEDPELTAAMAVSVVRGVQAHDVAVTVKHFVANDTEVDRLSVDVRADERVLRELYLRPFEAAVRAGAWGVMSAYNRIEGAHCAESSWLLRDVLRDEWGFDGFVVSDWYGAHHTVACAEAGLDVEMPGPARVYGAKLEAAVASGDVTEHIVDGLVRDVLVLVDRVKARNRSADVPEQSTDDPADRALCRTAAAAGTVLLRNERGALPLLDVHRLALLGPNAASTRIMGGGSSALRPLPHRDVLAECLARFASVVHEPGCAIDRFTPLLSADRLQGPDGASGLEVRFVNGADPDRPAAHTTRTDTSTVRFFGAVPRGVDRGPCALTVRGAFRVTVTGRHTMGVIATGPLTLRLDGVEVLTPETPLPPGEGFYGYGSAEQHRQLDLVAGDLVELDATMLLDRPFAGLRIGLAPPPDPSMLDRAVEAARTADAAVVVVGTNDEWETEGNDRTAIALPGRQDELVSRVAAVNARTVVVVNAGSPVSMPWADDVAAVVVPFFGGQETAPALVDVLAGAVDPGGRLPVTFPKQLEDAPAMRHYHPVDGVQAYRERFAIGYRGHDLTGVAPLFPFGHGLSYGEARWEEPSVSATEIAPGETVTVTVPVTAVGSRDATVVVQGYLAPVAAPVEREPKALRAWAKAVVPAGATRQLTLTFGPDAFRRWDDDRGCWTVDPGRYDVLVAASAADVRHVVALTLVAGSTG